jgi:predicted amidophosphoribosyltransferase
MPKPSLKLLYELTMQVQEITESELPLRVKRARLRPLYQEIDATEYALDTFPSDQELCSRCQDRRKTEENFNNLCDSCAMFLMNHIHEFGRRTDMSEEEVATAYARLMQGLLKRGKIETKPIDMETSDL